MRYLLTTFLLLAALCGAAQPACVVTNCCCGEPAEVNVPSGDFEDPPFAAPIIVYFPGQNFGNWTVLAGSVDVLFNYINWGAGNPNGNSQYIDLHGNDPGDMATTLTGLTAGNTYTLVFWYAKNAGVSSANCRVRIGGGAWLDQTFTATNNGFNQWLEQCYTFTAQGTTAQLRFTGSGGANNAGVLLDDITLWGCDPDTEDPVVQNPPPTPLQWPCDDPLPPPAEIMATDNCNEEIDIELATQQLSQPCLYDIRRLWTVTDYCGNSVTVEQIIEVRDTEAPLFLAAPSDRVVGCGENIGDAFTAWIMDNGDGLASDNCDPDPEWTADYFTAPDDSCGETLVTFTVTDDCGNSQSATARFIVADSDPPLLIPAQDRIVYCAASPTDSLAAWLAELGGAEALDPCGPVVWTNDYNGDPSPEVITVTFTATDGCGNDASTTAQFVRVTESDTTLIQGTTCDPALTGSDTTVVDVEGCLSVTITTVSLLPSDTLRLQKSVCAPGVAGTDTLRLQNRFGCDSLVITTTTLLPSDTVALTFGTCDLAAVGKDTLFLKNAAGCDSIVFTTTTLLPGDTLKLTFGTCDPAAAGKDTLNLKNAAGCDSIVFIETVYSGQFFQLKDSLVCGKGTPYSDTLVVTGGPCDSLFITRFKFRVPDTTFLSESTCLASQAGVFMQVLNDAFGCDSTIIRTVQLLPADTVRIIGKVCDKAKALHDTLYLKNANGCDSLVLRDIAWVGIDTQYLAATSCLPADTGVAVVVSPGPFCDTVRVIQTTLIPFSVGRDTVTTCDLQPPPTDTLLLTNAKGCDSLHIRTFIARGLQAAIETSPERCRGENNGSIRVIGLQGGTAPISYTSAGITQAGPLFANLPPGVYTVSVSDAAGCTLLFSNVQVASGEVLTVDAGPDQLAASGSVVEVELTASAPPAQVLWTAVDPLQCPSCPRTGVGPLTVEQTVSVSIVSATGCSASDALLLQLERRPTIYIPNAFSPDNDGINDGFTVYTGDQVIAIESMAIYDRWGNALFRGEGFAPNDPTLGWDGRFRDRRMDPGVYVYVVILRLADGSERLYKGDVTLLR